MIFHLKAKPETRNDNRKLSFTILLDNKESNKRNIDLTKDSKIDINIKEIRKDNIIEFSLIIYDDNNEINRITFSKVDIKNSIEKNDSILEFIIPGIKKDIKYNTYKCVLSNKGKIKNFDFSGYKVMVSYSLLDNSENYEFINSEKYLVDRNGIFTVQIPESKFLNPKNKTINFTVRSISGMLIDIKNIDNFSTSGSIDISKLNLKDTIDLPLDIPDIVPPIINLENQFPSKTKGKVVDVTGKTVIKNAQLLFFITNNDNQEKGTPFLLVKTNGNGDFTADYPQKNFDSANSVYVIVSLQPDKKIEIKLNEIIIDDNKAKSKSIFRIPEFIYIVLYDLVNLNKESHEKDDCNCKSKSSTSRLPDHSDLLADNSYSQDIGTGCVNFTTPNRSLEEFSYYSVVRTTEPEIMGLEIEAFDDYLKQIEDKNNSTDIRLTSTGGFPYGLKTVGRSIGIPFYNDIIYKKRQKISDKNFVDWDNTPTIYQAVTISHGHILQFKQIYYADGYSMGDLLYSLPLAPLQKKQIVIYDWERKDTSSRQESLDYSESLDSKLERDRDISEVQNALTEEHMKANSSASSKTSGWSAGASVAAPVGPALVGVSGGYSSQKSSSNSNAQQDASRSLSASMNQSLRDKTMQASSAVRSQRATVINTATQGETMTATTEVIANHNHCHAVTIQYFEVLRHIAIKQELVDVQECLFIPLLMTPFDESKIQRWREHLAKNLIAPPLKKADIVRGFDAVERKLSNNYGNFPDTTFASESILDFYGEIKLSFFFARPDDSADSTNNLTVNQNQWSHLSPFIDKVSFGGAFGMSAIINMFQDRTRQERDRIYFEQIVPKIAEELSNKIIVSAIKNGRATDLKFDIAMTSNFSNNSPAKISFRRTSSTPNIKRDEIDSIEIALKQPAGRPGANFSFPSNCKIIVNSISIKYQTKNYAGYLINNQKIENDLKFDDSVLLYTPSSPDELRNPKKEDETAIQVLKQHLDENLEHYHHAIWWNMNPQRRFTLLDGIKLPEDLSVPESISGKSVASIVENRLIGFAGNSLIMPVAPGFNADPIYRIVDNEENYQKELSNLKVPVYSLIDHYKPNSPVDPFRISLPTKGVFAESVMGACNCCEKIDDSRFWKFEEHPSPDEPTAINPINTDSRYQKPIEAIPTQLPQPVINIQNAPAAPDPTGLGKAFELLGKNDLFKDFTGLTENQKNSLAALMENSKNISGAISSSEKALEVAKDVQMAKEANDNTDKKIEEINKAFPENGTDEQKKLNQKYKEALFNNKFAIKKDSDKSPESNPVDSPIKNSDDNGDGFLDGMVKYAEKFIGTDENSFTDLIA